MTNKDNIQKEVSENEQLSLLDKFVFMDKTLKILDIGLKTGKNIVLYGPGGHGKSEVTMEFFYEKEINPYVITMGTGMSTERLFGGTNIRTYLEDGKLEYLVENSFMNHEYVVMEEMMDAPDFILEQLKDILSSGVFRNGTQVFPIKTKFIVCCTNRTREEFSKNDSLKALMERFPLEHNVIWDTYNETTYTTLLKKRYEKVDPIIPFILQEYSKNNMIISPRIALDAYEIYEECGPDDLLFIADFAKKSSIINEAIKKFQDSLEFKKYSQELDDIFNKLSSNSGRSKDQKVQFVESFDSFKNLYKKISNVVVSEDLVGAHTSIIKLCQSKESTYDTRYFKYKEALLNEVTASMDVDSDPVTPATPVEEVEEKPF